MALKYCICREKNTWGHLSLFSTFTIHRRLPPWRSNLGNATLANVWDKCIRICKFWLFLLYSIIKLVNNKQYAVKNWKQCQKKGRKILGLFFVGLVLTSREAIDITYSSHTFKNLWLGKTIKKHEWITNCSMFSESSPKKQVLSYVFTWYISSTIFYITGKLSVQLGHLNHVTRKPVCGVFDPVRLKLACLAPEAR